MKKIIHAIYENGVLKPVEPLEDIAENSEVELSVQYPPSSKSIKDVFGILPKQDADEMRKIVEEEFEKVDLNEW
jgi:predicted DNA-binding antitoxin AbrB/MazE fold protein